MSRGIFVTGTGTDVGKTFVTALMVKTLRGCGLNAGYYKAALSGAKRTEDTLVPGDAKYVCDTAKMKNSPASLVSFIYETPVSPHLASEMEGTPFHLDKALLDFQAASKKFEYLTVEGCGGIICPLRREGGRTMQTDLIKALGLEIIIVAGAGLGAINSAVLTSEYAKAHDIKTAGFIINGYDEGNFLHRDNLGEIEELSGIPVIATAAKDAEALSFRAGSTQSYYKEIRI